jgi:hypothetical protein
MESTLTIEELEARWEKTLLATQNAAAAHPGTYRRLKSQAAEIVETAIDINAYFPTVEKLVERLKTLDPSGRGSIFDIFGHRISPSSIWQVRMLRMECKDLLAHLDDFDKWRREKRHLRRVK